MADEKVHVLKVHHLRPAPGAKKAKTRVGRVKLLKVRQLVAVLKVLKHVTKFQHVLKAVRCHCICVFSKITWFQEPVPC